MVGGAVWPVARRSGSFEVAFVNGVGEPARRRLEECWDVRFELGMPARSFPSFKGQRNWPGLWWSATNGCHVGYESWLERDVAMMLDFDPDVVGFASQPFRLCWPDGAEQRQHVPDFFARRADGTGVVVDVRPDDRIGERDTGAFAATELACRQVGWQFRRTGGPGPLLAANVRWLAGYRHPRHSVAALSEALLVAFAEPAPLMAGARAVGDPILVLPVLYHLLWRHRLVTGLSERVLGPGSVVGCSDGWAS